MQKNAKKIATAAGRTSTGCCWSGVVSKDATGGKQINHHVPGHRVTVDCMPSPPPHRHHQATPANVTKSTKGPAMLSQRSRRTTPSTCRCSGPTASGWSRSPWPLARRWAPTATTRAVPKPCQERECGYANGSFIVEGRVTQTMCDTRDTKTAGDAFRVTCASLCGRGQKSKQKPAKRGSCG